MSESRIIMCRITGGTKQFLIVWLEGGGHKKLLTFDRGTFSFIEDEFIGLTVAQAEALISTRRKKKLF